MVKMSFKLTRSGQAVVLSNHTCSMPSFSFWFNTDLSHWQGFLDCAMNNYHTPLQYHHQPRKVGPLWRTIPSELWGLHPTKNKKEHLINSLQKQNILVFGLVDPCSDRLACFTAIFGVVMQCSSPQREVGRSVVWQHRAWKFFGSIYSRGLADISYFTSPEPES